MSIVGFRMEKHAFVCPTAGDGALSRGFLDQALLFDKNPVPNAGVMKSDYRTLDVASLGERVVVFENPPFDQHNAVLFFNTMVAFENVEILAIVFPDRFRSDQVSWNGKSILNPFFHCVDHMPLPFGSFEIAGSFSAKIQCSFQIWERRASRREPVDIGIDVGKFHNFACNGGDVFWVKRLNPLTHTGSCPMVTKAKPRSNNLLHRTAIPVRIRRFVPSPLEFVEDAYNMMWQEYPHHSLLSLHPGNLRNIFIAQRRRSRRNK
jgi:hypothetical protein